MSLHVYTFAQLKSEAEHAIGGTPDARIDTGRIVNGVIDFVANTFPWSWRQVLTTLSYAASQGQIALPADFGMLLDLVGNMQKLTAVKKASIKTVQRVRIYGNTSDLSLLWCLGMMSQSDVTAMPLRCIEVAPVPVAALVDALSLSYLRLIPSLSGDTDVPAIPAGMHEMLVYLCRGHSMLRTRGDGGMDMQTGMALLNDFKASDGLAEGQGQGELIDAIYDSIDGAGRLAPHTQILMPGD